MRIESLRSSLAYFPDLSGFWQIDNLPATALKIRALLVEQPSRSIELLIQLARVRGLQGDLIEAQAHLQQAKMQMAEESPVSPNKLSYLLENGRILLLSMSPRSAEPMFRKAWEMAIQSGQDFFAIDAALMLSRLLPVKSQKIWFQRARQLVQQSKNAEAKLWQGQLNLMAGWLAFDLHRFDDALLNFEAAIVESEANAGHATLFPMLWGKARVLRALGRISEAMTLQLAILDRMQTLGAVNGHVYLELAECNQLLKKHEEARAFFELAHTALSTDGWFVDNHSDELDRMKYIFKKRH
jgi:tetratricopeptide (TPR) repeat protein